MPGILGNNAQWYTVFFINTYITILNKNIAALQISL
ncbi:hypothetical protein ES705_25877 [subsurface metagenome]